MSAFRLPDIEQDLQATEIRFPDFDVSWAGSALPWRQGFCFGSEDGRIRFTEFDNPDGPEPIIVAESREAVNGVAFSGDMMAVSTRSEVVFWYPSDSSSEDHEKRTFEAGAHRVVVTSRGHFIAPLGIGGLLIKDPTSLDSRATKMIKLGDKPLNIYKAISLDSVDGFDKELIVCAARRDGVAILRFGLTDGGGHANTLRSPGSDVVDVCSIATVETPLAVAALGKDRSLHLIRNVIDPGKPLTLRFSGLSGTAYRILSARGHLFLLTSRMLYVLPRLASRFLNGERLDGDTSARALPLQAVDANIVGERLLIIMPDHVQSFLIEDLAPEDESRINGFDAASRVPTSVETSSWSVSNSILSDCATA